MAQSIQTIPLPSLLMTSSSSNSSTQTIPFVDISDAASVSAIVNGATTAPGLVLQASLTADGSIFANLTWPSSGLGVVNITSALVVTIPVAAMLLRIASTTGVTSTSYTVILSKQVYI